MHAYRAVLGVLHRGRAWCADAVRAVYFPRWRGRRRGPLVVRRGAVAIDRQRRGQVRRQRPGRERVGMSPRKAPCPVCESAAMEVDGQYHRGFRCFDCPRCGEYMIHTITVDALGSEAHLEARHRISAWLREQHDAGRSWYELPPQQLHDLLQWLPQRGVREQLDMLLRLVEQRTRQYGESASIDDCADAARLWTRGKKEVLYLANALASQGRVVNQGYGEDGKLRLMLTPAGFLQLEELEKSSVRNDRIFVAMWFTDDLKPAGKAICDAIESAGYSPHLLLNQPAHGDRIDAKILVDIRRSRGVIVDATGPLLKTEKACARPSVMYEGGFAEGLGKPVIWTVRQDQVDDLPFDTRQLFHVTWKEPADLLEQLKPAIEARFGSRNKNRP